MAISVVQHNVAGTGSTSGNSVSVTVSATGSGNLLVAAALVYTNTTHPVVSITDGTNNFTQVPGADSGTANAVSRSDIWYLPSSASGKTSITANFTAAAGSYYKSLWVWEVSGMTNVLVDAVASGQSSTGSSTRTGLAVVTTVTQGFAVAAAVAGSVTANPKVGNEFTAGGDIDATSGSAACSLIYATAASHQAAWSDANSNAFATSTVAFKSSAIKVLPGSYFNFFR